MLTLGLVYDNVNKRNKTIGIQCDITPRKKELEALFNCYNNKMKQQCKKITNDIKLLVIEVVLNKVLSRCTEGKHNTGKITAIRNLLKITTSQKEDPMKRQLESLIVRFKVYH